LAALSRAGELTPSVLSSCRARLTRVSFPPFLGLGTTADLKDGALGALAALSRAGGLTPSAESMAVSRVLANDANVLLLAKHFGESPRFGDHLGLALAAPAAPLSVLVAQAPANKAGWTPPKPISRC